MPSRGTTTLFLGLPKKSRNPRRTGPLAGFLLPAIPNQTLVSPSIWGHIWGNLSSVKDDSPRMSATLDDSGFSALQPKDHPYKVSAGASLFLEVNPHGSKLWRLKYLVRGTEKGLALGTYPTM